VAQPSYPADRDPAFNLTSGPAGATAATLAALGRPILHHLDPAFGALYQQTVELLRRAFGTRESPVILQGEAVVGLEAAAASLIGPGDVVLNLVSGMYGRGYGDWARRYAREVIEIEVPYDSSVPAVSVADAFRLRPDITVVCVVHCETPCGTVNISTRSRPWWPSTERCSSWTRSPPSAASAATSPAGRPAWW
jgi:pyridoxamine--pyruvate transaminase